MEDDRKCTEWILAARRPSRDRLDFAVTIRIKSEMLMRYKSLLHHGPAHQVVHFLPRGKSCKSRLLRWIR